MAVQRYNSVPAKTLNVDLSSSGTNLVINDILDWDKTTLVAADFAVDYIPAALINDKKTKIEFILIDATTLSTAATTGATIFKRGLDFKATGVVATDQTEIAAHKEDWTAGETKVLLGTNPPYLYGTFANKFNVETIEEIWTFNELPTLDTYEAPTANAQFAAKKYVDDVAAGGTASIDRVLVAATAGETVAAGNLVYNDDTDNEWKLCDADTATTVEQVELGIAQGAGTNGAAISGGVLTWGLDSNQSGMTKGDVMFAGNTAGAIASSAGTTERAIGKAASATELFFDPYFFHTIKEADKDLLEAITASAAELNKLDGWAGTQANLTEMSSFFDATDISGAEAETLTDGSDADALHSHQIQQVLGTNVAGEYWTAGPFVPLAILGWTAAGAATGTIDGNGRSTIADGGAGVWTFSFGAPAPVGSSARYDYVTAKTFTIEWTSTVIEDAAQDQRMGLTTNAARLGLAWDNATDGYMGFAWDGANNKLYAVSANGTAESTEVTGFTATDINRFKMVFVPGTDTEFYVNGTLKATHSTNILAATDTAIFGFGAEGNNPTFGSTYINYISIEL